MKTEDEKFNKDVQELAENLTLHLAAMKPNYLNKREVPQEVKDKLLSEGEKILWKMYKSEVLMEQELATSEDTIKVKDYIRLRESELATKIDIREWALLRTGK